MSETVFCWPISSEFGWGIRGLNYALSWDGLVVSAMPEGRVELPPNDPRKAILEERLRQSRQFRDVVLAHDDGPSASVLVALGNDLETQRCAFGRIVKGKPTIACPVFEDVASVTRNIEKLKRYDAVVVASRWNQEVLDGLGVKSIVCHEGIDPIIFNPTVKRKRNDGRFRVFSGGKAEYRKGQDLVIEAFKLFAETHDDAVLVAAWGSPFGALSSDFDGKWEYGSPPGAHIGRPNFHAWVERAGIRPHQFEYVEPRANWRMAEIYGSCDMALFPNRCEGGTNFVAMECMACGVPAIVRPCFGHADLYDGHLPGDHNDRDATHKMLEDISTVYSIDWSPRPIGRYWTWDRHCRQMAEIIANA